MIGLNTFACARLRFSVWSTQSFSAQAGPAVDVDIGAKPQQVTAPELPQGAGARKRNGEAHAAFSVEMRQNARQPARKPSFLRRYEIVPWAAVFLMAALWPRGPSAGRRGRPRPGRDGAPVGRSLPAQADVETICAQEPGRGRGAAGPTQIPPRGWLDILWRTWKEVGDDRLPAVAGGVTFYALLAIFPALGVFVSLYGLVADIRLAEEQITGLIGILPSAFLTVIGEQMVRLAEAPAHNLGLAFVVSLVLAIWTASSGVRALFDALNIAYDESEKRSFLRLRLLTLGATVALLAFIALLVGLLVAVPALSPGDSLVGQVLRWVAALVLTTGLFSLLYRFGPSRARPRWQWVSWGSGVAALLWMLGSLGFSAYVSHFAHYDRTYGSLGAVIAFMVWIWVSVLMLLLGAELNAEIEHQTAIDSTTGPSQPMGARGAAMADTVGSRAQVGGAVKAVSERLQKAVRPGRR
jgi:membrane protein